MRNLIKRLINWAFARDLDVEFKTLGDTSCELNELKDGIRSSINDQSDIETIVHDSMHEYSSSFETLNNYDWDDFSQRLDNVQHLEDFSVDDFREQLEESLGVAPNSISNQTLADQISNLESDLGQLNSSIEQTDEWFQSFLNATHEHFMQQAGSKD
jgi:hypothetical protein